MRWCFSLSRLGPELLTDACKPLWLLSPQTLLTARRCLLIDGLLVPQKERLLSWMDDQRASATALEAVLKAPHNTAMASAAILKTAS
jgi:hypothetical protein